MIEIQRNYVSSRILGTLDDKVVQALRLRLRYKVPGFRFAFMHRTKWSGDGYKYLITPKQLRFPSGLLYMVEETLKEYGVEYIVTDLRIKPVPSNPISPKQYVLRDYQEAMEKACLDSCAGIVRAATGSGKTAVFTSILGKLNGLKQVVYVRKLDLMQQTIRVLTRELGIPIGEIGGGKVDIQDLSVAMVPTVARALGEQYVKYDGHENDDDDDSTELTVQQKKAIKEYVENADVFICDECHCLSATTVQMVSNYSKKAYYRWGFCLVGGTLVSTEHGPQTIETLYNSKYQGRVWSRNDQGNLELCGINCITRRIPEEPLYEIKTVAGSTLRVTSKHPILTNEGYKESSNLKVGDLLVSTPYLPGSDRFDFDRFYDEHLFTTYSVKSIRNDAQYRVTIYEKKRGGRNRPTKHKVTESLGKAGNFDAWWAGREIPHICQFIKDIKNYSLTNYDIGLLLGMMLGDGHLMRDGGGYALLYTSNIAETQLVSEYLTRLHIPFSRYSHQGDFTPEGLESDCEQIKISGVLPRFFAEIGFPIGNKTKVAYTLPPIIKTGSRDSKIGFLRGFFFADGTVYQQTRFLFPEIKLSQVKDKTLDDNLLSFLSDVQELLLEEEINSSLFQENYEKSKRGIYILASGKARFLRDVGFWQGPKQEVAFNIFKALQKLKFVANEWYDRVVSIDSYRKEPVYDVVDVNNTHNFIANNIIVHNSATPWRTDGTDILLNAATGPQIIDVSASELIKRGFLVPPRIHFYRMPRDFKQRVPSDYQTVYTQFIVENQDRNEKIVRLATFLAKQGERPVILVQRQQHGKTLEKMFEGSGLVAKFIYGESSMTDRWLALEDFTAGVIDVIIGSSILQEGIDVPCITALINAAAGKSSSAYYQKIGRAIRTNDGKTRAIVVDFIDQVKWLKDHAMERIRILKTEPLYQVKIQD